MHFQFLKRMYLLDRRVQNGQKIHHSTFASLSKVNIYIWGYLSTLYLCVLIPILHCLATPWTVACQAPLSMGLSRQEYWSGLPSPSLGDLPDPGIEPMSLTSSALTCRFFTTSATWEYHLLGPCGQLSSQTLLYVSRASCMGWGGGGCRKCSTPTNSIKTTSDPALSA